MLPRVQDHLAIDAGNLLAQRRKYRSRLTLAKGNAPDSGPPVFSEAELARYTAVEPQLERTSVELRIDHVFLRGHDVATYPKQIYAFPGIRQGESVVGNVTDVLKDRLKDVRKRILKLNQTQLSNRLGVSQSHVSRWELGEGTPEPEHLLKLANLLGGTVEALYFIEAAGIPQGYLNGDRKYSEGNLPTDFWGPIAIEKGRDYVYVPLLRDAAAAGTTRAMSDEEVESFLPMPRGWTPRGGALVAVRIVGDSMAPLMRDGSIVVVNTAVRERKKLVDQIVAARDADGVTIKHLRRDGDTYMLVAYNRDSNFPATVFDEHSGFSIVGVVLNWISFPGKL